MHTGFIFVILFAIPSVCFAEVPDHSIWDNLLEKYVTENGFVRYESLLDEQDSLKKYLQVLSENPPQNTWSRAEKLAYWINAYNAFTLDLILENYPLESINDIGGWLQIPFVNSVFDKKFFEIGGEKMSLNNIEHGIIRKEFDEPRIHFAVNCASVSCPPLRREAYKAESLDRQLQEQAIRFINDPDKNKIGRVHLELSKIFQWYTGDFKKNSTLIGFINRYTDTGIDPDAKIDYLDYDWGLNEAR